MIEKIIELYKPSYIDTLAYLLQANEYNATWYLKSYNQASNFSDISKQMRPIHTRAYMVLKYVLWTILATLYVLALLIVVFGSLGGIITGLGVAIMAPVLTAYIIVIPLVIADWLIRKPREKRLIKNATEIIQSHRAIKIAVVGSFGKTTMKEILTATISGGLKVASTPGNYNTPVGVSRFASTLEGDEEVLIVEMGEYIPGDITGICQIVAPDYAVITGINEQHLQRMETLENTINSIFEVAQFVHKDKILVNTDSLLAKNAMAKKNVGYNQDGAGKWKVKDVKLTLAETKFTAVKDSTKLNVKAKILGRHQIGPMIAAVYLANRLGVSDENITAGLASVEPKGRRFNPRTLNNGATFIDDTYNGNPDGFLAGIDFLSELKNKKSVYITGGIIELGSQKVPVHQFIGQYLAKSKINRILLIETPATEWIAQGLAEEDKTRQIEWIPADANIYDNLEQFVSSDEVVLMQNWQRENIFYEL